ncbi:MAG: DNA polymerase III subunit epsilon [Ahrensia sp.]|nr:DNA polymerase III subunit epsilon [Ahrensia sp.]
MREIIFDTETTGLSPADGDRIIEIGALEMIDRFPTGRSFHHYLHPGDRAIHPDAQAIHGISVEDLEGKPGFADILDEFEEFFGEGKLVAHNATFDMGFFNAELRRVGRPPIGDDRVIDTLVMAKRKFPGQRNSLDALCGRFGISNAHRTLHGALLDSELLLDVYLELTGGRQAGLGLDVAAVEPAPQSMDEQVTTSSQPRERPTPLPERLTEEERLAHRTFVESMGDTAIWHRWQT